VKLRELKTEPAHAPAHVNHECRAQRLPRII
jgi:hypothetical protein